MSTLSNAWRSGLVSACFGIFMLVCIAIANGWVTAILLAAAWLCGLAFRGAYQAFRQRIALDQQLEQAYFYRAQLDALERELQNPDPRAREAAERRLRELDPFYTGELH